ncbi:MAG: hypothetical protein V7K98_07915 [Nostoc sp.]
MLPHATTATAMRSLLENSASEPTLLTVKPENIRRLRELMNNSEADSDD